MSLPLLPPALHFHSELHFGALTLTALTGIDFKIKTIECEGKRVKLQIWDTAGQERFRTITTSYFRGAQGILLVYEVTDLNSFHAIKQWVEEITNNADKHINKILIGNKCDVEDSARAVTRQQGEQLAKDYGMAFFETSAKKDIGVSEAFQCIAKMVVTRLSKDPPGGGQRPAAPGGTPGTKVELRSAEKKKGCCGS